MKDGGDIVNLPLLTARIGRAWADEDIFSVLYQEPRLKQKEDKRPYIVFMTFDLCKNEIDFGDLLPYNSEAIRRYKYFGNNKAAAKQFHVVREGKDLYYLIGLWQNLRELLESNDLKTLSSHLLELNRAGLIEAATWFWKKWPMSLKIRIWTCNMTAKKGSYTKHRPKQKKSL